MTDHHLLTTVVLTLALSWGCGRTSHESIVTAQSDDSVDPQPCASGDVVDEIDDFLGNRSAELLYNGEDWFVRWQPDGQGERPTLASGTRLIVNAPELSEESAHESLVNSVGRESIEVESLLTEGLWLVRLRDIQDSEAVKRFLRAATPREDSDIRVFPDYLVHRTGSIDPDDLLPLRNRWVHEAIGSHHAWVQQTGDRDTKIAVVDSGFDYWEPALEPNAPPNIDEIDDGTDNDASGRADDFHGWDFVEEDDDPSDPHRHGTWCAAFIGETHDLTHASGVNWQTGMIPVRILDDNGCGFASVASDGISYSAKRGARVVSASWGFFSEADHIDLFSPAIQELAGVEGLLVAAAGNEGENIDEKPFLPGSSDEPNVLTVTGINENQDLLLGSYGCSVELAAPWGPMTSFDGDLEGGTSLSTALVAGAAALLAAEDDTWGYEIIKRRLVESVFRPGSFGGTNPLEGCTSSEGVLRIDRALLLDLTPEEPPGECSVATNC